MYTNLPISTNVTRLTNGNEVKLGQFYNAYMDQLIIDSSIFTTNANIKIDTIDQNDITVNRKSEKESNPHVDILENSHSENLKKFQLDNDLIISIICGVVEPQNGPGTLLTEDIANFSEKTATLYYSLTTKAESVDLSNENVNKILISSIPKDATHVVTGLEYGIQLIATFTWDRKVKMEDLPIAINDLREFMELIVTEITTPQSSQKLEDLERSFKRHFKLKEWHSNPQLALDLPTNTNAHANYLILYLRELTYNVVESAPIKMTLCSIASFFPKTNSPSISIPIFNSIDTLTMERIFAIFYNYMQGEVLLKERKQYLKKYQFCIDPEERDFIHSFMSGRKQIWDGIKRLLKEQLEPARRGISNYEILRKIVKIYTKSNISFEHTQKVLEGQEKVLEKIHYIIKLGERNGRYYNNKMITDWRDTVLKVSSTGVNCYVFFCNWNDSDQMFLCNKQMFDNTLYMKETFCTLIDLDKDEVNGNRISYYNKDGLVCDDLVKDGCQIVLTAFAMTKTHQKISVDSQPLKTILLKIACPNRLCEKIEQFWLCDHCKQSIEFGFDGFYYCHCGKSPIENYTYKCPDLNHGNDYIGFDPEELSAVIRKMKPLKEINLLVLGETGVGKSTWINAIANYASFTSLNEAMDSQSIYLLPVKFSLQDREYQDHYIRLGCSENELFKDGQSCTQSPKAYSFKMGDKLIRIIDTPGIGDTRGLEEDRLNTAKILEFLSGYQQLHGICILLKTTDNRLTPRFSFCLNELLVNLHKSATSNIVFCFTFARGTMYTPGQAKEPLREFLENLQKQKGIKIPMVYDTMYCLDNEAFRFLCGYHAGIKFADDVVNTYSDSWKQSVIETNRLFDYIFRLQPHNLTQTISLNACRQIIVIMAELLVNVSSNIAENITSLENKKKNIQENQGSQSETNLIETVIIPLEHGRMKCRSDSCNGKICHDKCHVTDGIEIFPCSKVKKCKIFRRLNYLWVIPCKICGCTWDKHVHVTFEQENRLVPLNSCDKLAKIEDTIEGYEKIIELYNTEYNIICRAVSKFGSFLRQNAILEYNNAFESYIEMAIKEEMKKCSSNNYKSYKLKKLRELLKQYEKEVQIFEKAMSNAYEVKLNSAYEETKDEVEIFKLREELFSLPLTGDMIKENYDKVFSCKIKCKQYEETVFDSKSKGIVTTSEDERNVKDFLRNILQATKTGLKKQKQSLYKDHERRKIIIPSTDMASPSNQSLKQENNQRPTYKMEIQIKPCNPSQSTPNRSSTTELFQNPLFNDCRKKTEGTEDIQSAIKVTNIDSPIDEKLAEENYTPMQNASNLEDDRSESSNNQNSSIDSPPSELEKLKEKPTPKPRKMK